MIRDPFDGLSGDELDPQAAESDQLMALGMHVVATEDPEEDEELEEEETPPVGDDPELADPSDDLDKDGLKELEEMEKKLLEEEPLLDFATMTDEE
ncbi:MAG: hypothetical protein RL141_813 [Candidatus Parcubacteria bacterium]|jgi:hypothetical protein